MTVTTYEEALSARDEWCQVVRDGPLMPNLTNEAIWAAWMFLFEKNNKQPVSAFEVTKWCNWCHWLRRELRQAYRLYTGTLTGHYKRPFKVWIMPQYDGTYTVSSEHLKTGEKRTLFGVSLDRAIGLAKYPGEVRWD